MTIVVIRSGGVTAHTNMTPSPHYHQFASYRVRQSMLRARRQLKASGITLAEDLTKENYDILRKAQIISESNICVVAGWTYIRCPPYY